MAEYMITRSSIINQCNRDGNIHLKFSKKEQPCREAYLKELDDTNGERCSRYFIELSTIEDMDALGENYDLDVLVTRNMGFDDVIALVLYDEEIDTTLF